MTVSPFPAKMSDQLSFMQKAVGGYIEVVPMFNMFDHDGKAHMCATFCDEEGKNKGVPVNREATKRWDRCLEGQGVARNTDFLVGPVLVLYGDPKLLAEL